MRLAVALLSSTLFIAPVVDAAVITLDEFTGDNVQMQATITDLVSGGVNVNFAFTASSQYTGDITGVWLGIDDSQYDPSQVQVGDVQLIGLPATVNYVVTIGEDITNLGNGVNLTGENGFIVQFDLDLGLRQTDSGPNNIISSVTFNINRSGLLASYIDAAGARVMSISGGPEGSSKLAGGVPVHHDVPEPGSLALLGAGLVGLGLVRRRHAATA